MKDKIIEYLQNALDSDIERYATEIESLIKENYVEKELASLEQQIVEKEKTIKDLTDAEIRAEAKQYAVHHSNAPDKDCPEWIIMDFEAGAKWARMKTIGVIQDLTIK